MWKRGLFVRLPFFPWLKPSAPIGVDMWRTTTTTTTTEMVVYDCTYVWHCTLQVRKCVYHPGTPSFSPQQTRGIISFSSKELCVSLVHLKDLGKETLLVNGLSVRRTKGYCDDWAFLIS